MVQDLNIKSPVSPQKPGFLLANINPDRLKNPLARIYRQGQGIGQKKESDSGIAGQQKPAKIR